MTFSLYYWFMDFILWLFHIFKEKLWKVKVSIVDYRSLKKKEKEKKKEYSTVIQQILRLICTVKKCVWDLIIQKLSNSSYGKNKKK